MKHVDRLRGILLVVDAFYCTMQPMKSGKLPIYLKLIITILKFYTIVKSSIVFFEIIIVIHFLSNIANCDTWTKADGIVSGCGCLLAHTVNVALKDCQRHCSQTEYCIGINYNNDDCHILSAESPKIRHISAGGHIHYYKGTCLGLK